MASPAAGGGDLAADEADTDDHDPLGTGIEVGATPAVEGRAGR